VSTAAQFFSGVSKDTHSVICEQLVKHPDILRVTVIPLNPEGGGAGTRIGFFINDPNNLTEYGTLGAALKALDGEKPEQERN
jgi:hypothetical protein